MVSWVCNIVVELVLPSNICEHTLTLPLTSSLLAPVFIKINYQECMALTLLYDKAYSQVLLKVEISNSLFCDI